MVQTPGYALIRSMRDELRLNQSLLEFSPGPVIKYNYATVRRHDDAELSDMQGFLRGFSMRLKTMMTILAAIGLLASTAAAQEGTLKKIKDTGAITIGHRESSVPFSYYDDKQQVVGYAMDLCNKIVDAVKKDLKLAKLDVKLQPVTSATRIPLLANGTTDLELSLIHI